MFELRFEIKNAAFFDDYGTAIHYAGHGEIARILRKAADEIENDRDFEPLIDVNGNAIGTCHVDLPNKFFVAPIPKS